MIISLRRAAVLCVVLSAACLLALLPALGATTGATHPQQRQIAVTTLTSFKVVLTVTRGPMSGVAPRATVTAAGYRNTTRGWKLIGQKRIGQANQWFWYPVTVCGLTVTQLKPMPSSAVASDTLQVSLLITPALGCSKSYAETWRP